MALGGKKFEEMFQRAAMQAMGYEPAKAESRRLEVAVDESSAQERAFPHHQNGLVPDAVRLSPEYRLVRDELARRFAKLRAFNGIFVKVFAKEIKEDRRKRDRERQAR